NKYENNHPDLIIIAPYLLFANKFTIDLTCKNTPGYPDNKPKAENGKGAGEPGEDGKPGLPGFNGGNLIIYADKIINENNMKFVSIGGQGGPGQS
ncbi:unnamed protein product, partial [Brachionus calyciflorus]